MIYSPLVNIDDVNEAAEEAVTSLTSLNMNMNDFKEVLLPLLPKVA